MDQQDVATTSEYLAEAARCHGYAAGKLNEAEALMDQAERRFEAGDTDAARALAHAAAQLAGSAGSVLADATDLLELFAL